jgi:tetratricopeptide (TPR) repeat protein
MLRKLAVATALLTILVAVSVAQAASGEAVKRNNFGAELLKQGKLAEAIAELQQAVTLDPTYAAAFRNLGYALDRAGQGDEAIAAYRRALALEPRDALTLNNLGVLYDKAGRYDEAFAAFEQAAHADPSSPTIQQNLENARQNRGIARERDARIAEALNQADAHPADPRVAYQVARVYAATDDKERALAWLEKAIELGFDDLRFVSADPTLAGLHRDPRFEKLLGAR